MKLTVGEISIDVEDAFIYRSLRESPEWLMEMVEHEEAKVIQPHKILVIEHLNGFATAYVGDGVIRLNKNYYMIISNVERKQHEPAQAKV